MEGTKAATMEGYKPPAEFREDSNDTLLDIDLDDSKELWLIQWPYHSSNPYHMLPDFDGQELTLKLNREGRLGSLQGSSGKEYKLVSPSAQEPDATVFVSSQSESKIVGRISRRVSIIHYPDGAELEKEFKQKQKQQVSSTSHISNSSYFITPDRSARRGARKHQKSDRSSLINSSYDIVTSSQSRQNSASRTFSGHNGGPSSLSGAGEASNAPKREYAERQSIGSSGRGQSGVTSSTSARSGHSSLSEVSEPSTDRKRRKSKVGEETTR